MPRPTARRTLPATRGRVSGLLAVALGALAACGLQPREDPVPDRTIEEVQEAHTPAWLELPGVVGSGIGLCDDEEPCIRVFLAHPSPEAEEGIPERVEGYRVELVVTGGFRPRPPADTGSSGPPSP